LPKIEEPIVSPVSVYVVNLLVRPFSVDVEPSQSMSEKRIIIDPNISVSVYRLYSRYISYLYSVGRPLSPTKHTFLRKVVQNLS